MVVMRRLAVLNRRWWADQAAQVSHGCTHVLPITEASTTVLTVTPGEADRESQNHLPMQPLSSHAHLHGISPHCLKELENYMYFCRQHGMTVGHKFSLHR